MEALPLIGMLLTTTAFLLMLAGFLQAIYSSGEGRVDYTGL